jgi:hypothetical protein
MDLNIGWLKTHTHTHGTAEANAMHIYPRGNNSNFYVVKYLPPPKMAILIFILLTTFCTFN